MMFDDKVGGWGWLNKMNIQGKKTLFPYADKKVGIFLKKLFLCGDFFYKPGSDTILIISIKTYLKSIYPVEDITDQFDSSD